MHSERLCFLGALTALWTIGLSTAACGDAGNTGSSGFYPTGTGGSSGGAAGKGGSSGKGGAGSGQGLGGTGQPGGASGAAGAGGGLVGGSAGQGGGAGPGGASGEGPGGTSGVGGSGGTGGSGGSGGTGGSAGQGGSPAGGAGGTSGSGGAGGAPVCKAGTIECDGKTRKVCDGNGGYSETTPCAKECDTFYGCVECIPGTGTCSGQTAMRCKPDGSGYETTTCDADLGLACAQGKGTCEGPCSPETLQRSYIGCEYFPTVTSNGGLFQGFNFAVVVANTSAAPASIKVTQGTNEVATAQVAPGTLQPIKLPWVAALVHDYSSAPDGEALTAALTSGLVGQGAYRLTSTQPVTVYQFNPLEFELKPPPAGCPDQLGNGTCHSFTNDASLLLPSNSQGNAFIVASSPALIVEQSDIFSTNITQLPGLVAVTATQDNTSMTFTSTAYVRAGQKVLPMNPGEKQTFMMNRGDVVQLLTAPVPPSSFSDCTTASNGSKLCRVPNTYDLSGSQVESDKPVQVIGGHDCTFMPYSAYACDHIEESIFPTTTLGAQVIVTAPQAVAGAASGSGAPDKQTVRVISAEDNNQIELDPPLFPRGTLNKGQYADVPLSDKDFVVKGTGRLLVVQYMLGADFLDPFNSGTPNSKGDPSLSIGIPSEQYRSTYTFLAPETYTYNFVNIVAPMGAVVKLDGAEVTGAFTPVGNSGHGVLRKAIAGGAHSMTSDTPFGIVVYGYGAYTSYMYPGGLNLNKL